MKFGEFSKNIPTINNLIVFSKFDLVFPVSEFFLSGLSITMFV